MRRPRSQEALVYRVQQSLASRAGTVSLSAAEVCIPYIPVNSGCTGVAFVVRCAKMQVGTLPLCTITELVFEQIYVDPNPLPMPSYPHACGARTVPLVLDARSPRGITVNNSYPITYRIIIMRRSLPIPEWLLRDAGCCRPRRVVFRNVRLYSAI